MREVMLIIHFLGLAMGLGTCFAFLFLGIAGSKMEKEAGKKFKLDTSSLIRMGHIGLGLSIISGLYLMTPFWESFTSRPLLIAKLAFVVVLTISLSLISVYARRARRGETEANLRKIANQVKVAFISGIFIVTLAVLVFR
jgi:uncharacterized membrane protein